MGDDLSVRDRRTSGTDWDDANTKSTVRVPLGRRPRPSSKLVPMRYCTWDVPWQMVTWPAQGDQPLHQDDLQTLVHLLLYGTAESRRRLAERLLDERHPEVWTLLAATARSREDPVLRARCLEVLGLAAATAGGQQAELILSALLG